MKTLNKKQTIIAAAVAGVVVVVITVAMLSSSGKKATQAYYDEFKDQFYLENVLSEGEISYSFLSGNLTVEDPEIRLVAAQTNGAESFLKGMMSMLAGQGGRDSESGLTAWSRYLVTSTTGGRDAGGVYLKADALKVSRSGSSKDGEIHIQLLGMDMSNPFISRKGSDVVLVADVADEIQPRAEIDQYGRVVKSSYGWGSNMVARLPFTGAFITAATSEFGSTIDLDLTIKRSDDGEGKLKFVVVHRNDGSEIGRITREAKFASVAELDTLQEQLKAALNGFVMAAYSPSTGQMVFAEAAGNFARKTKVVSYSVTYKGFEHLEDAFDQYKSATQQKDFNGFCAEAGLSTFQNDFGTKAKNHSDSECAIAQKLVSDSKFEESYTFKEDKSLFADLFVSKGYTVEAN